MLSQRDPRELLPLTEAEFHILLALMEKDQHGFGLMEMIKKRTEGKVSLGPATMYRSLEQLQKKGLIEETNQPPEEGRSRRPRYYYHITGMGRDVAKEQALRQAELIKDAVSRIIHNEMPEQQQPDTDTWAGLQVLKKLRLSHNSS
jgi:DNA-binding PadR family transcriptional regulator